MGLAELIMMPMFSVVGLVIMYAVVKLAVKNAIKDLKNEGQL